ncbi:MAG: PAAR domain-containing protein [Labilithrix sp.]
MRMRSILVFSALVGVALRSDGVPSQDACRVSQDPSASWLLELPVTPALAAPPARAAGAIAVDDLDGEWSGDMTLATVQSPLKQVESMMAPYVGMTKPLRGDAVPSSDTVRMTFSAGGSPFTCPFTFDSGHLVCDTTTSGHSMHWAGAVVRDGSRLRIDGSWQTSHPMLRMTGRFRLEKPAAPDPEIEILYPAGKSPQVFVTGWPFGVRCIEHKGTKDEKDISKQAAWSGTGRFDPPVGERVVSHFSAVGWNKLTVTCGDAKRSIALLTVSTLGYARVGDKAQTPSDAHGCPSCAHTAAGPIVSGSPTVTIDGRPAARVGDRGIHNACCGTNAFTIVTGSPSVLIDGRPAAIRAVDRTYGSRTQHCGGVGSVIEGSDGDGVPRGNPGLDEVTGGGGGGFFGMPFGAGGGTATGPGTGPAGRGSNRSGKPPAPSAAPPPLVTGSTAIPPPAPIAEARGNETPVFEAPRSELRVIRNTAPGATRPSASLVVLPASRASRGADGSLSLERGAVVVTTLGGAKQTVMTPEGSITLGSQARIARVDDGIDVALLSGAAKISPRSGVPFDLTEGSRVRFTAKGPKAPASRLATSDLASTFASFAYPESASVPREGSLVALPTWILLAALVAALGLVGLVVALAIVARRRRPAPVVGSQRGPSHLPQPPPRA